MKRYIIDKKLLGQRSTVDAMATLASSVVITDHALEYKNIDFASVMLTDEQAWEYKKTGLFIKLAERGAKVTLGRTYEKERTKWVKANKKRITGIGCKVAVLDSGCEYVGEVGDDRWLVPDVAVNFANANPGIVDGTGHGTAVTSIIKSSIGLANGCELHMLKIFDDDGSFDESSLLAAVDYCIDNNIDIANMSFNWNSSPFAASIVQLIASGCVVVGATGNYTFELGVSFPAGYDNVVAVNAIKEDGQPHYLNVLGGHGVDFACSGYSCETYNRAGNIISNFGTSFSAPFFCGVFACYKEQFGLQDNYAVLDEIRKRAVKVNPVAYFGNGIPTF